MDEIEIYILRFGRALLYALAAFILIQWLPYSVMVGRWSFASVILLLAMTSRTQVIAEIGLGILLVLALLPSLQPGRLAMF
jgi:hypothetical protein